MASQEVLHVELPSINPYAGGASIPLGTGGNRNRQSSRSPPPKFRNRAPQDTRQRSQTPPRRASRRASPPQHRRSSRRQSRSPSRQPRFYTSENEDDELSDRPPPREAPRNGYSSPPPSRRYKATDHQSENPKNDAAASGRYVWTEDSPWDQRVSSKSQRPPDDEYYGEPEYIRVADRDRKKARANASLVFGNGVLTFTQMNPPRAEIKEHEPVDNKFYQSNAMPARTKSTAGGGKINHVVEESESASENFSEPIIVNRAAGRVAKPAGRQSGSGVPQSSTQGKKPVKGKQPAIPGNIMSGEESEGAYGRNPEVSSEASDISGDESDDRYPRCRRCGHRHHPKRRECPRHKERRRPPVCPPMCPPWLQPPFIPQWPWYDIPRLPCNPRALPYSYGRPVFADIPELPDLIKQLSMSYYSLPVPPLEMIRELREQRSGTIPENPEPTPPTKPVDGIRNFNDAYAILETPDKFDEKTPQGKTARFLSAMSGRETTFYLSDQITRMLTNMIQVRFAERKGTEIVNRSRLVPRGRLGMGITFDARTKLDYDLVIPGDFVLRRWNVNPPQPGSENRPRTMTEALGLSTAAIARGQIEALKLDWVIESVYQQLNGSADAFIFPGGAEESSHYLPPLLYDRYKNDVSGANRLRLMNPNPPISFINIYIKVALSVNGQDMIIGVDYSSARANGMYQMIKVSPAPGVSLGEAPSDPVDRSAIILLNWWKRGIKTGDVKIPNGTAPTSFTLRTNHFILALAALHKLDATDPLYVPRASQSAGPFSLERMLTVAHKILTYVERAYNSSRLFTTVPPSKDSENGREEYVFPLLSCTTTDVLYTQAMAIPGQLDNLIASQVIPTMISRLAATISNLTVPASKTPIAPGPGPVAGPGPKTQSKFGWTT